MSVVKDAITDGSLDAFLSSDDKDETGENDTAPYVTGRMLAATNTATFTLLLAV